mmetsp:Transcript_20963/g.36067  ORF Transcript_20963/g.36067 Transcript_20963/m.36067 type:complete len:257 (+) Transcript_20963:990-1760(+)
MLHHANCLLREEAVHVVIEHAQIVKFLRHTLANDKSFLLDGALDIQHCFDLLNDEEKLFVKATRNHQIAQDRVGVLDEGSESSRIVHHDLLERHDCPHRCVQMKPVVGFAVYVAKPADYSVHVFDLAKNGDHGAKVFILELQYSLDSFLSLIDFCLVRQRSHNPRFEQHLSWYRNCAVQDAVKRQSFLGPSQAAKQWMGIFAKDVQRSHSLRRNEHDLIRCKVFELGDPDPDIFLFVSVVLRFWQIRGACICVGLG